MTIDVEDWFHILEIENAPGINEWGALESRVERNVDRLLTLLDESGTTATCFFLGWIVERHPEMARRIADEGHEIATHGYGHDLVNVIGPERFREDLGRSIQVIEAATGKRPKGYRAPGFSITADTTWAFDILSDLGMEFDASIFPVRSGHGGIHGWKRLPHRLMLGDGRQLLEFPVSVTSLGPKEVAYSGGGYLRLFPHWFIRSRIAAANTQGEPVMIYVHPRDIDSGQPRIKMGLARSFKSYVNLGTTYEKLRRLLSEFEFGTVSEVLGGSLAGEPVVVAHPNEPTPPGRYGPAI